MSLQDAARILVNHRIHRVVVSDPDDLCKPIGILSLGDIMRYLERLERGEETAAETAPSEAKPTKRAKRARRATRRPTASTRKKTTRKRTVRA